MDRKRVVLVTGGTRSGKSEFAEQMAFLMKGPVTYVATMAPGDDEMARRVALHRERRPGSWTTVEEMTDIPGVINRVGEKPGVILVDCLTGWLSNLLLDENMPRLGASDQEKETYISTKVEGLVASASGSKASVLIVSDEVGMGLVPPYPLGRLFRDISGKANRRIALAANEVYLVVSGLAIEIKSLAVNLKGRN
ncbi:MAG: bifunctional adenosylcobinamide kinase/adenosylcobinamide-phosphate guanylyltransferase [Bacillota bacterium]